MSDGRWVSRGQAAAVVLGEPSFAGQVEALVRFALRMLDDIRAAADGSVAG